MTKAEFVFRKLWPERCWHEVSNCYGPSPTGYGKLCAHCKFALFDVVGNELMPDLPTFTDGNGMMMLRDRIVELGKWDEFTDSCEKAFLRADDDETLHSDYIAWLINPPRFLDLVYQWLGENEYATRTR